MNKADLVDVIARRTQIGRPDVTRVLNEALGAIGEALARGEKIGFVGFGSFVVRRYPEQQFTNPKSGKRYVKPPRAIPRFTPSPILRKKLAKKLEP